MLGVPAVSATVYSVGRWGLGYVRDDYGVPARRGMRVIAKGLGGGVITSGDGAHIRVRLDGERNSAPHHPLSLDYLDGVAPADRLRERNEAIRAFNRALNQLRDYDRKEGR
jgi:hypothetical protein